MSLKSSLLALAGNIGKCQENSRSIKQALVGGLAEAGTAVTEWTLVKTETGTTAIALPESFEELCLIVQPSSGSRLSILIPALALEETGHTFASGRFSTSTTGQSCAVNVSITSASLTNAVYNTNDVTSGTKLTVYYR